MPTTRPSILNSDVHSALYLSVPFCRTKCTFCNFASGVSAPQRIDRYLARLQQQIAAAPDLARQFGVEFDPLLDSVYLGGGTPTVLTPAQLHSLFAAIGRTFHLLPHAEFTVEIAPGTLSEELLAALIAAGVNRVSLGVQSFIDQESRSVGRLHSRAIAIDDIRRLRAAGITNISVDLIAGLPHQTAESWEESLDQLLSLNVPHVSVYMLEVDGDSRLGRELIAGGTRYHAHHVPDEAATVAMYERACQRLNDAGIHQYEISNFARPGHRSRHNLRYWQRLPYYGFGLDAHSMFPATQPAPTRPDPHRALRLAEADALDSWLAGAAPESTIVTHKQAIEETYFLGLRMNHGVELLAIKQEFGIDAVDIYRDAITTLVADGLLLLEDGWLRLTPRGRLLSNNVFAAFLRD